MAEVLNWQSMAPEAVAERALNVLAAGGLVAFPTETVYGIAADPRQPAALERLVQCKGRPENKPLTLTIPNAAELIQWLPLIGKVGQRLARRCWPGPLTLVSELGVAEGRLFQLPVETRRHFCPQGSLGLRVPCHDAILDVLACLGAPLALTSANRSGEPDGITGAQVLESLGGAVDLIVDDGPSHFGRPSTVVRVSERGFEVLRVGVLSAEHLHFLSRCMLLFVCTGNTCRSPLAEGLCKKLLAERLGCAASDLEARGFLVLSAGVCAMMGTPVSPEAVVSARQRGVDLAPHASRPLTKELLEMADHAFVMTRGHLRAVEDYFGPVTDRVALLSPTGADIADPIGGEQEVYDRCADEIVRCLEGRIPMLDV